MSKKLRPPKRMYLTVEEWQHSAKRGREIYRKFDLEENSLYRSPKGIEEKVHWKFMEQSEKVYPCSYIVLLNKARVCGSNGSIITSDNRLLYETSFEYGIQPRNHPIFSMNRLPKPRYYSNRIADLSFCASEYYYHWMFDVLPRLHLLEQSQLDYEKIIINRKNNLAFQDETLHLLGVDFKSLIECSENFHIEVEELIIPSSVGYTGHMPKWTCDFLRNRLLKTTNNSRNRRLFISRKNAGHRKLVNEDEIMNILEKYGFERIILEKNSVAEQIQLFASAETIISPHGGGLTNLVFCQPGTKIIEFFSPSYVNVLYWILSNHMELDYYYIIGEGVRPADYIDPHLVWEDIFINGEDIKKILNLARLQ